MYKDIIVVCPDCNNPIYIYNKETVCFCKKCKNDYRIIKNEGNITLEKVINIEKKGEASKKATYSHYLFAFILFIFFCFEFKFIIYDNIIADNKSNYNSENIINNSRNKENITRGVTEEENNDEISFLADINKISEDNFKIIDEAAAGKIIFESRFDQQNGFDIIGKCKRNKVYLLNKKDNNLFIPVYLCTYSDNKTTYNVYSPVVYENVKYNYETNEFLKYFPPASKNTAPKVNFVDNQSEYTIGYLSLDELYINFIKKYENDYKITEKSY